MDNGDNGLKYHNTGRTSLVVVSLGRSVIARDRLKDKLRQMKAPHKRIFNQSGNHAFPFRFRIWRA